MGSELQFRGEWWLPQNPGKQLSGILTYSQESGALLELDGAFTINPRDIELFHPPIVNGTSNDGLDITLCKCIGRGISIFGGAHSTSRLYAHHIFKGAHFSTEDEIKLSTVTVSYSHLDTWLGISGFKTKRAGEEILIKFKTPPSIKALVSSKLAVSIDFGYHYSPFALSEVDLSQSCSVTFLPAENIPFSEYQDIILQFQNFLSLATATYVYPTRIGGIPDIGSYKKQRGRDTYVPKVEILYQLARSPQTDLKSYNHDYLFTFKDISNRFEKYLQAWFNKYELLKPVHQLYFGTLYNPAMYQDQKFLAFIQALEAYHRRTTNNCELPEEKHKERIDGILATAPAKHREWLKTKLEYSNEPSLRKRLKWFLENKTTSQLVDSSRRFINDVCITRNYLTHYDSELEAKSAKGKDLYNLTQKLKVLIEACLLRQIGFPPKKVNNILQNN